MKKQNTFEKIDEYFAGKKKSEILLTSLVIGASLAFLVYMYVFPMSKKYHTSSLNSNKAISTQLNEEENFVKATKNGNVIGGLENEIRILTNNLNIAKDTNTYVNTRLRELSYLLFDDKNWAKFLDSISTIAQKHNVKVLKIANTINKPNPKKVEQILNVDVEVVGKFHGIMKLINTLEESMLIVDVNNIKLVGKNEIEGKIKIAVWGMKY